MLLAFPPIGWWWLAFVAPAPLLWLVARSDEPGWRDGFWAAVGVAPFWAVTHAWIGSVSAAGLYPLVVYLCLPTWVFVCLGRRVARVRVPSAVALPLVWCGVEFARAALVWNGYAWYLTGHPLIDSPGGVLAWPASVGGATLVSFLTLLPAAWFIARPRAGLRVADLVLVAIVAAWTGMGVAWSRGGNAIGSEDAVHIGVIQTNVPQDNRLAWTNAQRLEDWLGMRAQTERLAGDVLRPDVIVWPEGLVPGWATDPDSLDHERSRGIIWRVRPDSPAQAARLADFPDLLPATWVMDEILAMQARIGVPMLIGSVAYDGLDIVSGETGVRYERDAMYNSVFLLERGRVVTPWYDKVHLTPFGEVMPYISAWPWLEQKLLAIGAGGMSFELDPARSVRSITLGGAGVELATPICFEATLSRVTRRLVRHAQATGRPVVMVNVTNDGWFGKSDRGRRMHAEASRWRCVELGVPLIRCANTGVSGHWDARGRQVSALPARETSEAVFEVIPSAGASVYARVGEWAGWSSLFATLLMVLLGSRRRASPAEEQTQA